MARFKGIGKASTKGQAATQKQRDFIEELTGCEPEGVLTAEEASELIDEVLALPVVNDWEMYDR